MPLAVCLLAALTLLDHFNVSFLHPRLDPKFESLLNQPVTLEGIVLESPERTENGAKAIVSLPEKILLTSSDEDTFAGLESGDIVQFSTRLKRPTRTRNPGQFDYRRFLERKGILLTGFLDGPGDIRLLERDAVKGSLLVKAVDRLRTAINGIVERNTEGEEAGFLKALVTGDRSGLTEAMWEDFRRTGTAHLIAISGQHIAIVGVSFLIFILWVLKRSERLLLAISVRKLALALTLIPILLYTLVAGSPPSAVRAAILSALVALGTWTDHEFDSFSALAAAAIAIPLMDPSAPFSASFQLSFLAVFGILCFSGRGDSRIALTRAQWYLIQPLRMTIGATLATAPLVAYTFHQVSLSGVLTNLWAIPAVGFVLVSAGVSLALALLIPPLGRVALQGVGLLAHVFLQALHWNSRWSWVVSFYPTAGEMLLGFALVASAAWAWNKPRQWRSAVACGIFVLLIVGVMRFFPFHHEMEVTFLDVGQGDSALVIAPSGKTLLVDGGGFLIPFGLQKNPSRFDVGSEVVAPYLKTRGIRRIDAILLSHPHPDHYGGLRAILENFEIGEFWWNGQTFPDVSFDQITALLRDKRIPTRVLRAGDRFSWADADLEVVYPERVNPARNINDNSLVVRLAYGGASVLFSGDIEDEGEEALSDKGLVDATILKIPHHASRTSSSVPFIDSVKPLYAVASLGDGNLFGFPHPGILEKYERRGVTVFRTDRNGAVTFRWGRDFPRRPISIRAVSSAGSP